MKKPELPSEKAERIKRESEEKKRSAQEAEEKARGVFARAFSTPDGIEALRLIRQWARYGKPILGAVDGKIDRDATLYQAMRLNLYLEIRGFINSNILKEIEYDD